MGSNAGTHKVEVHQPGAVSYGTFTHPDQPLVTFPRVLANGAQVLPLQVPY